MNQPVMDNDVDLLRRMGEGDRQAFSRFYDQYAKLLYSLAFRILNEQQEAEDVLQEVFTHIWSQARHYHPRLGKPAGWAVGLTRNKAVDYLRAYQHDDKLHEQAAAEMLIRSARTPTANESVRNQSSVELISAAVADLPEDQRKAMELAFFTGLTLQEISETMRAPAGAVRSRLRDGLLKLRSRLEGVA
jgi:RNA polymerase sigma-70 factor (ECF subfamily)